jgi:hypothetical protein
MAQCVLIGLRHALRRTTYARIGEFLRHPRQWLPRTALILGLAGLAAGVIVAPLHVARRFQHERVGALVRDYLAHEMEPVDYAVEQDPNASFVAIRPQGICDVAAIPEDQRRFRSNVEYLVFQFDPRLAWSRGTFVVRCPGLKESLYIPAAAFGWRNRDAISETAPPYRLFFPAYYYNDPAPPEARESGNPDIVGFDSFKLWKEHLPYLQGVYRVRNLDDMPLLLTLVLPPDWELLSRCQRLKAVPDLSTRP